MMYQLLDTELCTSGDMEIPENPVQAHSQQIIHKAQIQAKKDSGYNHDKSRAEHFLPSGP